MIELHQYPPVWGLSSLSPFCIKVELFLKVHQIGYKSVYQNDPRRGPKGKMPVIKDGGQVIADSHFILKHLKTRFDCSSTNYSSSEQAGEALAFRKMIEESLYFSLLYSRWVDPEGWKVIHYHFKNMFPLGLGTLALKFIRNQLLQQAKAQGIGRHSKQEVYSLALEELSVITKRLERHPYLMGEYLTEVDVTLFSFLATFLKAPIENPLKSYLSSSSAVQYVKQIDETYFANSSSVS